MLTSRNTGKKRYLLHAKSLDLTGKKGKVAKI